MSQHILMTTGVTQRKMPENWQVAENAPEAMLTVTIPADALTRLIISLETGDVRLAPMQLKTLNVALTNGGLRAEDLTVTRDLLVELPAGGCVIDHLSVAEYANITATRCIQLHLDDLVTQMGSQLYNGRIEAEPLVAGAGRNPCVWCDYSFICCHETGIGERALDAPAKPFEPEETEEEEP